MNTITPELIEQIKKLPPDPNNVFFNDILGDLVTGTKYSNEAWYRDEYIYWKDGKIYNDGGNEHNDIPAIGWFKADRPAHKFKRVARLSIDVAYNDFTEIDSLYSSILDINENSEFDIKFMEEAQAPEPATVDVTEKYRKII